MPAAPSVPRVAIACGGTGGHLFPGQAVGEALRDRGAECLLLVSLKLVDRRATRRLSEAGTRIEPLPAVGWHRARPWAFLAGLRRAWCGVQAVFSAWHPDAVLAMGGFTAVAPILAGIRRRLPTFLHDSNAIPGRANRWLARWVSSVFVGFPQTVGHLRAREVQVCGTPVRSGIRQRTPAACRVALGLEADRPTVLVMGGSQGARAINRLMLGALGHWPVENVEPQFVHLTGEDDHAEVQTGYARRGFPARVAPFLEEMDLALGAADIAVTRAGASTLAELAAVQLPAILIPFPAAADNHQFHNARAYVDTGAAWLCEQGTTTEAALAAKVRSLLREPRQREAMAAALARWHRPAAAADMAGVILRAVESGRRAGAGLCRGRRNPKVTAASGMERRGQRGQGTSLVVRAGL